jgi:hypothetical protein
MPRQKRGQCDADAGETLINGGCWVEVGGMTPPCRKLFRNGNRCYRPVAADPDQPVGDEAY